jgi:hypothetical protein
MRPLQTCRERLDSEAGCDVYVELCFLVICLLRALSEHGHIDSSGLDISDLQMRHLLSLGLWYAWRGIFTGLCLLVILRYAWAERRRGMQIVILIRLSWMDLTCRGGICCSSDCRVLGFH